MAGSIPALTATHHGRSVGVNRKGHDVSREEMMEITGSRVERLIDQILQEADDALMLEAWSRIDAFIAAERVA